MTCLITKYIAGPCEKCGQRAEPGHVVEQLPAAPGDAPVEVYLYCAACCPKCTPKNKHTKEQGEMIQLFDAKLILNPITGELPK